HDSSGILWLDKLELIADKIANQPIRFQTVKYGYAVPSVEQRQHSRDVVLQFRRRELETRAASKIRNDLEALVIEYRARLFGDDSSGNHGNQMKNSSTVQPIYSRCSSKKERQELLAALAKAEQALAAGSSSNLTMLNTELKRLKQTFAAVSARAI
uniref:Transposase n=1 Tax=Macrostomum lignano TaxID=282301 RepID=A0A1I8I673_9PLAT